MEYGVFKALQALLFFGGALGFGIWQLIVIKRELHKDAEKKAAKESSQAPSRSNT